MARHASETDARPDAGALPSSEVAVRLDQVHKRFGDVSAVDGVTLDIDQGAFLSILGPSGSGKTTCLRMIAGFESPDRMAHLAAGGDVTDLAPTNET